MQLHFIDHCSFTLNNWGWRRLCVQPLTCLLHPSASSSAVEKPLHLFSTACPCCVTARSAVCSLANSAQPGDGSEERCSRFQGASDAGIAAEGRQVCTQVITATKRFLLPSSEAVITGHFWGQDTGHAKG